MASSASGVLFTKRLNDVDMILFKGKTVNFSVVWGGSNPIDVTGYTATMWIKNIDGSIYQTFNSANSRVTIGGANGVINIKMTATDSAALTAGNYIYEIEVSNTDGIEMLASSGKCKIQ